MCKVSVIVPNYNHAPYLKQRINSILNQTFQDFELIILDDCSTDNSQTIIEEFRNHPRIATIIYNDINSGSAFKQWEKGIERAKGKYIWIAESDDWCELTLLEHLIEGFSSSNCVVSYCQTYCIRDNVIQWQSSAPFLCQYKDGGTFVKSMVMSQSLLSNASMVLWKKTAFNEISREFTEYKLCGDWLFWMEICSKGDVYISGRVLNYFRKHKKHVNGHADKFGNMFIEGINALISIFQKSIITYEEYEIVMKQKYQQFKVAEPDLNEKMIEQIACIFSKAEFGLIH